jgi:hypothetical protein
MGTGIPNFTHRYKFWFYFRKGLFQVFLPILLTFMSFCDFINQNSKKNNDHTYNHLYLYTALILFLYGGMKYILDFIFSMCSDDVILKKEINLNGTTPNLMLSLKFTNSLNDHFIIVTKKIFKLRYSKSLFFKNINKLCWFLGIDSPLLIPYEIISKLGNVNNNLTPENEEIFLHTTLINLYTYHPEKYSFIKIQNDNNTERENLLEEDLMPKILITKIDKNISEIQKELFNKEIDTRLPNV